MAELVGVHGIGGQQRSRPQLEPEWQQAVLGGVELAAGGGPLPERPVGLAFYGDLFRTEAARPGSKGAGDEPVWQDLDGLELADVESALREVVSEEDIAAAEAEKPKAITRVPHRLAVLLATIDRRFGLAAGVLSVGVLRQVSRYLRDPELKAQADRRVVEAVGADCRVLIGHSLGSVLAYEYLRTRPDHRVAMLITVGSPLGLRMVRERLTVAHVPVPVWRAVRDLGDPVTCAGALVRWWPQIGDDGDVVVRNGGLDAHAADLYLNRKATGRLVLQALPHWGVR